MLIMEKIQETTPKMMEMATQRIVKTQRPKGMREGLCRRSSSFTGKDGKMQLVVKIGIQKDDQDINLRPPSVSCLIERDGVNRHHSRDCCSFFTRKEKELKCVKLSETH